MTFRQILHVLWQRKLLILATVVIAFVVAGVFLKTQTASYSSTTTVRLSQIGTTAADSGQIGTTPVDFAIESMTLPTVLSGAAKISGDKSGSDLAGNVTYLVTPGQITNTISITAVGPTPASAQARANAVAKAYNAYLQTQVDKALKAAQSLQAQYLSNAQTYQSQITSTTANNPIAQANLATALANLGVVNTLIAKIQSSGPPLTVLTPASEGARNGVGTLTALLIALVAGLIAGIGIALIRDQFDNRLRGEQEIEEMTGVASLGELSLDRRVARRKVRLPAADRTHTALNEGLRSLRMTLQVLLPPTNGLVVFTSVEPGDGKTFVSANLALVWARMGKRVILVGGDLRRPKLAEYYDEAADGAGLADLLSAASDGAAPTDSEVESYLKPTEFDRLLVLPSGAEPPAPADLLATKALPSILGSLRRMCDIVIIDSPPSLAIVDAALLAESADGVVMVASIGRTNREELAETVHVLHSNNVPVLGVVGNRSRRKLPGSYGEYYTSTAKLNVASTPEDAHQFDSVEHAKHLEAVERANRAMAESNDDAVEETVDVPDIPVSETALPTLADYGLGETSDLAEDADDEADETDETVSVAIADSDEESADGVLGDSDEESADGVLGDSDDDLPIAASEAGRLSRMRAIRRKRTAEAKAGQPTGRNDGV